MAIAFATIASYSGSFRGPFVLDDASAVLDNATIRSLWPLTGALAPPRSATVGGRPLLNFSFALNFACGRLDPWGYHAVNLGIHVLAALALFGIVRRTLARGDGRWSSHSRSIAWCVALLWSLHPVQTEAVTYISQRAESLMGLFYLLALYGLIRGAKLQDGGTAPGRTPEVHRDGLDPRIDRTRPRSPWVGWYVACVASCLAGSLTKEVIVTAPVVLLLYDRAFMAGGFREALRRRWGLYGALIGTWLVLAVQVSDLSRRGVGFALGVSPAKYALVECGALVRYVHLAVWPSPLIFDYGPEFLNETSRSGAAVAFVAALIVLAAVGMYRWRVPGFLVAAFLIVLSPTSSFIPVAAQPIAESRLYLPLAAILCLAVAASFRLAGRWGLALWILPAAIFGAMTHRRNGDYRSAVSLWSDTVAKLPRSAQAHNNLGAALFARGDSAAAMAEYRAAIELNPNVPESHSNLANTLVKAGQLGEAVDQYEAALRLKPDFPAAQANLGIALSMQGKREEAVAHLRESLRIDPNFVEALNGLGTALRSLGKPDQAVVELRRALALDPTHPEANCNLADCLLDLGRPAEAIPYFEAAVRGRPRFAEAVGGLGVAFARLGRMEEARSQFETALKLDPNLEDARHNLEVIRRMGLPGK